MNTAGRILIADDENTFLRSTADLLREEGYTCECAKDGKTAAAMISNGNYDLVIADIKMPGNPGLELVAEAARTAEGLPIILVTGYPALETAIRSVNLAVAAYFTKPINFPKLLIAARSAIRKYRAYRCLQGMKRLTHYWQRDMADIDEILRDPSQSAGNVTVESFLSLAFRNVFSSLSDMKRLMDIADEDTGAREVCHMLDCPRLHELRGAVTDTIDTLESTKSSFKSKKLGDLRSRLEQIV